MTAEHIDITVCLVLKYKKQASKVMFQRLKFKQT